MSPLAPAAARETRVAARERKRNLDAVAVLVMGMVLLWVAGLWFLRVLEIDLAPPAWLGFAFGSAYLAVAAATDRLEEVRALERASRLCQLSLVVFLAALWHLVGGIANPTFLLVFFLPVMIGGAALSPRQPFLAAGLAAVLITAVAVAESPELGWWLERVGLPVGLVTPIGDLLGTGGGPRREVEASAAVALLVFAIALLFTGAVVAQSLTRLLLRLASRLQTSAAHLSEARDLADAILRAEPEPSVIVYADTGQVVQASDSFLKRMLLAPEELIGKTIFDLVRFSPEPRVRALLEAGRGEAPFCVYRVGSETRVANLSLHSVVHGASAFAYLGFKDVTESYYLNAAFDAIGEPVLVVGDDGRLRYANRAAEDVFGALHFNLDVTPLLEIERLGKGWWREPDPAPGHRRLEVDGRPFVVTCSEAPLPGESGGTTIISMRDVTEEERLFEEAHLDPLTRLYNRRYFERMLPEHIAAARGGRRATLATLVLDDLQRINDEVGQTGGDEAVRRATAAIRVECRDADLVTRLAGNQFGVVFRDTAPHEASIIIDRIYRRLERATLVVGERSYPIRFSAGAVAIRGEDSVETLLKRADALLQAVRQSGRGRCLAEV